MARRSSIDRLDPKIREQVDLAIKRGATVDEITAKLGQLGADVSRSAVGRYSQKYREFAERQRDLRSVAEAYGKEFGADDNSEGKLLLQMLSSIGARMAIGIVDQDDPDIGLKEFELFARATKNLITAAKSDADRDAKIREEATKAAREQAARDAESAARAAGASDATIDFVKRKILGLA